MKKIEKIIEGMAALVLLFMLVCALLQVLFRFALKISAPFTEEFARMGYIWMVFLMLPVLESRDEELKVTYFFDKIPYKVRVVLYWVMSVIYVLLLACVTYGAWNYFGSTTNLTFGSVRWLLMSYQYVPVIFGSIMGIVFIIYRAIHFKSAFAKEEAEYKTGEEETEC